MWFIGIGRKIDVMKWCPFTILRWWRRSNSGNVKPPTTEDMWCETPKTLIGHRLNPRHHAHGLNFAVSKYAWTFLCFTSEAASIIDWSIPAFRRPVPIFANLIRQERILRKRIPHDLEGFAALEMLNCASCVYFSLGNWICLSWKVSDWKFSRITFAGRLIQIPCLSRARSRCYYWF
jgi:hypothetical protein